MNVRRLGRYEIKQEVGRGGMSTIYLAIDPRLQRDVAIKVLPPELSHNPDFAPRFEREARVVASLQHPAILPIFDYGQDEGLVYIVMRYLSGGDLRHRLTNQGPLLLSEVVDVLRPIASALDFAHKKGVLHRDIKPSNIGFDADKSPILMDFGIASMAQDSSRLTQTGALIGTPAYMAPEQVEDSEVGPAVDIYALGVVAFEVLVGRAPYGGDSAMKIMFAHVMDSVPSISSLRSGLPDGIEAVFEKVLAKKPVDRYPTAIAFVEALAQLAVGFVESPPSSIEVGTDAPTTMEYTDRFVDVPAVAPPVAPDSGVVIPVGAPATGIEDLPFADATMIDVDWEPIPPPPVISPETPIPDQEVSFPKPKLPAVPPTVLQQSSPSLILNPNVHDLLAPAAQESIKDLMSLQDPERIVNYAATYGGGRFILTGYGSFGGTSLTREIYKLIRKVWGSTQGSAQKRVLTIQLTSQYRFSDVEPVYKAVMQRAQVGGMLIGTFVNKAGVGQPDVPTLESLLDTVYNVMQGVHENTALRQKMEQATPGEFRFGRLILTVDKIADLDTIMLFASHPLIEEGQTTLIMVIDREHYNRWPQQLRQRLQTRAGFQIWPIPSLWEEDYHLVESTMDLLFSRYQMGSSEAAEKLVAFKKHIAYLGRGQIGTTLYELRQMRYWKIDEYTHQPFILFDALDDELIRHHAWVQDLLEANWATIIGASFPGRERTERAKQGVYSLMDWIVDSSTFKLEEALEEGEQRPVWISPHKRLRDEVIVRLLEVLVKNNYLKRTENDFDIVWGRDINEQVVGTLAGTIYAGKIELMQGRLEALMDDYTSASEQLTHALGGVERQRLMRRLEQIDAEMEKIQGQLDSLKN